MRHYEKMKVTLFIPTRNEIDGARAVMPKIDRNWVDEVVIIDGGSTDGTVEYLTSLGYTVTPQKSKGIAGAYWECLEVAQGDIIVAFSPDGNSLPELIPRLINKIREGFEMVIASRYRDGAVSEDDDAITRLGNRLFTRSLNLFFGARYTDSLVMLRAFRKDLPFRLQMRREDIPIFEYELCIGCAKSRLPVMEIPASEPKRIGGSRKMRPLYNGSCLLFALTRALKPTRLVCTDGPFGPAQSPRRISVGR